MEITKNISLHLAIISLSLVAYTHILLIITILLHVLVHFASHLVKVLIHVLLVV